ncbi:MAG: aspartyl-tRNA(Asn)/glutamyl-tRNA(Gln) amidotransferase subunit [Acidobacteriota bacterium]|nr:aspartyl-tRNA(Asn)/glutamyl-tRNA(Gln) amidotransferase subunit [Acidobacteriota bacterium]
MLTEDTFFSPVTELAAQIRARKLSPVELTEGYLARLERYGARLGAVAHVMRESALAEARQAEREIRAGRYKGLLHGIPYGAKDLLATRNAPTTWGATPYKDQRFDYDATIIRKLRDAGAILVAKLAMVELAGGMGYNQADASLTGACRTPWNTDYWSGGSSSGPGAAVAAGLVAFAIGSETSGSIITPAAFCGVTGLRPTYGMVSRHGAMALCWTLDKLGPMCRSAADAGLVLAAIAGRDPLDASSRDSKFRYPLPAQASRSGGTTPAKPRQLRLAVLKDSYEKAQKEVRDNFLAALEVLKRTDARVRVEMDVKLPDYPYGAAVGAIVDAEGAAAFRDLIESGRVRELASPEGRIGGYSASLVTAVDYLHAMRMRVPMRRAWGELFRKYDVLVAPSRATVSYPVSKTFDQAWPGVGASSPIGASNLVGVPAISVPNGFGLEGLPTGIQFVGATWSELTLVELADHYQQATDWHKRRPQLA